MSRKKKLDPVDVEITREEFHSGLDRILKGKDKIIPILAHLEKELREEGNPLAAWEAILVCQDSEEDIPEWVKAYLGKVAWKLFEKPPKGNRASAHILNALGMYTSGKGNIFSRYFSMHDREAVVQAVLQMIKKDPNEDLEQHYTAVAEEMEGQGKKISNVTIAKWFLAYRNRFLPKRYKPKPSK